MNISYYISQKKSTLKMTLQRVWKETKKDTRGGLRYLRKGECDLN